MLKIFALLAILALCPTGHGRIMATSTSTTLASKSSALKISDGTTSPPPLLTLTSRCPDSCICNFENKSEVRLKNCDFSNNDNTTVNEIFFGVDGGAITNIEAFILEHYTGLKNLTRSSLLPEMSYSLIKKFKLSNGDLQSLEVDALNHFGSKIQHLDFAHNNLTQIPHGFFDQLTHLTFLNLSGNPIVTLDLSAMLFIKHLVIEDCPNLQALTLENFDQNTISSNLEIFSAKNNRLLSDICPWIFWASPKLTSVNFINSSSELIFAQRVFKANIELRKENISINPRQISCDCSPPVPGGYLFENCLNLKSQNNRTMEDVNYFHQKECQNDWPTERNLDPVNGTVSVPLILDCGKLDHLNKTMWISPLGAIKTPSEDSLENCPRHDAMIKCLTKSRRLFFDTQQSTVLSNGSLYIDELGWSERGKYECLSYDGLGRFQSTFVEIQLVDDFRTSLYYLSLIYAVATAGGFLLLTLLFKMIHFLLFTYGCCLFCCCCKDQLPPKAKQLKSALESIETYRAQQQDKLRDNYAQQSEWIRQNCAVQMERVRENYNFQVQNLRGIRDYGSCQVTAVRDQYYEQMARIRDYSTNHLQRVHENYIFQRQRLRKFNAQNYLKMRETRQYTRRTLQKVMENLPALYLDLTTCRQGLGERQPSIEWDPNIDPAQILELERFHQKRLQQLACGEHRRSESLYFTPSGTPIREIPELQIQSNPSSTIKNNSQDFSAYKAVYGHHHQAGLQVGSNFKKTHSRGRSLGAWMPGWFYRGTAPTEPSNIDSNHTEVNVQVLVESNTNQDYFDIAMITPNEDDQLLSSLIDNESGETITVALTSSSELEKNLSSSELESCTTESKSSFSNTDSTSVMNNDKKLSTTTSSSSNSKLSKNNMTEMTNLNNSSSSTSGQLMLNTNHFRSDDGTSTKPEMTVSSTTSDCGVNNTGSGSNNNSATTAKSDLDLCVRLLSENNSIDDDDDDYNKNTNSKNNKFVKKRLSL